MSDESAHSAGAVHRTPQRWLATAAVTATGAGPLTAGLQGNTTVAVVSASPAALLGLLFFCGVVCPAVWSRRPQRQRAALTVMNTLLGRGAANTSRRS